MFLAAAKAELARSLVSSAKGGVSALMDDETNANAVEEPAPEPGLLTLHPSSSFWTCNAFQKSVGLIETCCGVAEDGASANANADVDAEDGSQLLQALLSDAVLLLCDMMCLGPSPLFVLVVVV